MPKIGWTEGRRRALVAAVVVAGVAGCGRPAGETGEAAEAARGCRILERTITLPEGLAEASGAAWSRTARGGFWSHNDSGGDPDLFLVTTRGAPVTRVRLRGVTMADWEDVASGPCARGHCLFVADIGDNGRRGEPIRLFVLPEPGPRDRVARDVAEYPARFPDGKGRDAEAVFVLPDSSIYLITKGTDEAVELYRWPTPLEAGSRVVLERVRELSPQPEQIGDRVTGASASPDGRYVAVRSYGVLSIFRTGDLLAGREPAVSMDLTPLGEGQGEGVALADDGRVLLVSESGSKHVPGTAALLACHLP